MTPGGRDEQSNTGPGETPPGPVSLRRTGSRVRFWDGVAGVTITGGGLAVLAAMLGICVFLVASAAPLFSSGGTQAQRSTPVRLDPQPPMLVRLGVRESSVLVLERAGELRELSLESGEQIARVDVRSGDLAPSAASYDPQAHTLTLAYPDGTVRSASIEQPDILLDPGYAAGVWGGLAIGDWAGVEEDQREAIRDALRLRDGLSDQARVVRTGEDTWVVEDLRVDLSDPAPVPGVEGAPVLVHSARASARLGRLVCLTDQGLLYYAEARRVVRLGGGGSSERITAREIERGENNGEVVGVYVTSDGSSVIALNSEGVASRYDARAGVRAEMPKVETRRLLEGGTRVGAAEMALGGLSLLVGDTTGQVTSWTLVSDPQAATGDGRRLARASVARAGERSITAIGVGERDRTVAIGLDDGSVELRNMTSGKRVAHLPPTGTGVIGVALAPALDRAVAIGADASLRSARIEPGHPQAGWDALFGRVLYEGYDEPEFIYQSTGAQGAEAKLSLTPLIWGTLKATIVAMLFAAPIAVLGAVFSSEFLSPRVRRTVKPTVELMASLPSVVLGFVAAVLVAPYVRDWLPTIMVAMAVVPLTVMGAAHAWRLTPMRWSRRLTSLRLLGLVGVVLVMSVTLSALLGPVIERTLFAPTRVDRALAAGAVEPAPASPAWLGDRTELDVSETRRLRAQGLAIRDGELVRAAPERLEPGTHAGGEASIRRWLDGVIGGPMPGWIVAMVLPAAVIVALINARFVARTWAALAARHTRRGGAALELGRFVVSAALTLLLAVALAWGLSALGFDPRDSIFGPFTQRNTLVVGLVMGFAVIPIIYTIADDAMRAVPNTLRSASLGAGATRWQTAVRVVLPVAGSGIFSACMIGLGRAVGETMIVLMATGNTPEMTTNIFAGFRTLAANIAVELPEAARGGTHYRVLFLCGLVLFAMTAIINTSAELVRQSFRKRNAAL